MKFKYYDILTQVVVGYFILVVFMFSLGFTYNNTYSVPYLAGSFVIGYFINAISSLFEGFYYWTIGGKPSNKILRTNQRKEYSGISKVRFYHTYKVIDMLKQDLVDNEANEEKMFSYAMAISNSNKKSRVPDFNAHYAFSRIMLTTTLIIAIILLFNFYNKWEIYLILIPLILLSWNRYKERSYYYAREVLNEYMKKKDGYGKYQERK